MAAAATTRWRAASAAIGSSAAPATIPFRVALAGILSPAGPAIDLLSGDAPASLWQDRPFITFSSPEPGLPIPVAAPLAGDVGGNDLLAGGAGNDILIGDAGSIHGSARAGR